MRVAVTGASGSIGSVLSATLTQRGDEVVHLVRRAPRSAAERRWAPGEDLDPAVLADVDALVHLAGAGVGDRRWTPAYRETILRSRTDGTTTLARALVATGRRIRVVSGSAVGVYGSDRGDEVLTEDSAPGVGFLADVVREWEAAMEPAAAAGLPVTFARTGIVLTPDGGAMGRVLPLARFGLAGPLGGGRQFWPIITMHDEIRALTWLLDHPEVTGPVDLTAPEPVRQGRFMGLLGEALGRPARLPVPGVAVRIALGGLADDILGSQRVLPARLTGAGFVFDHPDGAAAARWLTSRG